MTYLFGSDETYRDPVYDDDYRAYLLARSRSAGDYRFARSYRKRFRVRIRSTFRRANGFLKNFITSIANSKLRRMERELELRGIRLDRISNDWVVRGESTKRYR